LKDWLISLKENLQIVDPWNEIGSFENENINIGNNKEEYFSEADIDFIDEKLEVILEALKEFATDFERIKDDLEYLKSPGDKISKKDWGLMVMGNVMGWAMSNSIPPNSLHQVVEIVLHNLQNQMLLQ